MNTIRLVTALLETHISPIEIPFLRGNMIRLSGDDPLFHNHRANGFDYVYPLVQYKRINGCAAVVGINRGGDALLRVLGSGEEISLRLGNREAKVDAVMFRTEKVPVACEADAAYTYSISRWLPLNSENYQTYRQVEALSERVSMLEKILVGNILSFAKGVGVFFESPVECRILDLESAGLVKYKEVELMSFWAKFRCNVRLPELIGLGKSVSMNHGVVKMLKIKNDE